MRFPVNFSTCGFEFTVQTVLLVVQTIVRALHLFLGRHELLVLVVITNFVEDSSDGVEKTVQHISVCTSCMLLQFGKRLTC
jgi:hypothetical protein